MTISTIIRTTISTIIRPAISLSGLTAGSLCTPVRAPHKGQILPLAPMCLPQALHVEEHKAPFRLAATPPTLRVKLTYLPIRPRRVSLSTDAAGGTCETPSLIWKN